MPLSSSKEVKDCPLPRRAVHEVLWELAWKKYTFQVYRHIWLNARTEGVAAREYRDMKAALNALEETERALGVEHVRGVER